MEVRTYIAVPAQDVLDRLRLLVWSLGKSCNRGRNAALYRKAIAEGLIPKINWEAIGARTASEMFNKLLGLRTNPNYGVDAFTQMRTGAQLHHLTKLEQCTGYALLSDRDRREVIKTLLSLVDEVVGLEGKEEAIAQVEALMVKWKSGASGGELPVLQSEVLNENDS